MHRIYTYQNKGLQYAKGKRFYELPNQKMKYCTKKQMEFIQSICLS